MLSAQGRLSWTGVPTSISSRFPVLYNPNKNADINELDINYAWEVILDNVKMSIQDVVKYHRIYQSFKMTATSLKSDNAVLECKGYRLITK